MIVIVNGTQREVPPGATVAELVEAMGLPSRGVAVAVETDVVPRSTWSRTVVTDGARVDVVTAMQGG